MKKLSTREFAAVKRTYKNVLSSIEKRNKNLDKIRELEKENELHNNFIDANEAGIKLVTGGVPSEALVVKVIEDTGKFNSNGKPIKVTKFVHSDIVIYDEDEKCYIIDEPEMEEENESYEIDGDAKAPEIQESPSTEGAFNPIKAFENN